MAYEALVIERCLHRLDRQLRGLPHDICGRDEMDDRRERDLSAIRRRDLGDVALSARRSRADARPRRLRDRGGPRRHGALLRREI